MASRLDSNISHNHRFDALSPGSWVMAIGFRYIATWEEIERPENECMLREAWRVLTWVDS
jgi:hypothetical protein